MRPISAARRRRDRGFALVEVLVALAIVAGIGVVSFIAFSGGSDRARVQSDAAEIALFLQQSRMRALETGQPVTLRIADGIMSNAHSEIQMSPGTQVAPSEAELTLRPSGENDGLALTLSRGATRANITIDWLTGRVTVQ